MPFSLWIKYKETSEIIHDDYGVDGPYTGFCEEQICVDFLSLHAIDPKDYFEYEYIDYDPRIWQSVKSQMECDSISFGEDRGDDFVLEDWMKERNLFPDKVWLVIVKYTDGGTFGTTHGYWKVKGVFPTEEEAGHMSNQIYKGTLPLPTYNYAGRVCEGAHEWTTYFASLDSVDILHMEIKGEV